MERINYGLIDCDFAVVNLFYSVFEVCKKSKLLQGKSRSGGEFSRKVMENG